MALTLDIRDAKLPRAFAILATAASEDVQAVAVEVLREWIREEVRQASAESADLNTVGFK